MGDAELPRLVRGCLRAAGDSTIVDIHVQANSRVARLEPPGEWRARITLRVKATARKGQANQEVLRVLSTSLAVKPQLLEIIGGASASDKSIRINGIAPDVVEEKLIRVLQGTEDVEEVEGPHAGRWGWDQGLADLRGDDSQDY